MSDADRIDEARRRRLEADPGDGSADNPLRVVQLGYACHHATLTPEPALGQHYKVVVFADSRDRCPACKKRSKT